MESKFSKTDTLNIKGIAILFMMFHHLFLSDGRYKNFEISFSPFSESVIVDVAGLFKACVGMFAFLSGYGLYLSYKNLKEKNRFNIVKWDAIRLIRTLSGYWLIYILCFITTYILSDLPAKSYQFSQGFVKGIINMLFDFLGIRKFFGTPSLLATWWYMGAAVAFILLLPMLYELTKKFGYIPVMLVIVALPMFLRTGFLGGTNPYSFIPAFMCGMMFADYMLFERIDTYIKKHNKWLMTMLVWLVLILALVICYFLANGIRLRYVWPFVYGGIPVVFILFGHFCLGRIKPLRAVFTFFGKYSMTIFLTHNFLRAMYLKKFIYSQGHFMKVFAALTISSLAVALIIDGFKYIIRYDKLVDRVCNGIKSIREKKSC